MTPPKQHIQMCIIGLQSEFQTLLNAQTDNIGEALTQQGTFARTCPYIRKQGMNKHCVKIKQPPIQWN
jgi:hypothetical protein